ncbi:MAG: DegT/DnrJ/EryC1/StrS family aminotransferase [Acidobacteria bacterium]|nr:DegT/DnrJ/EryC1/StrS family aminotransferase [Acidobacteriota bacterium]
MYVPTFQGLSATDFVRPPSVDRVFPFTVPHRRFYRARNAIYHLFSALRAAGFGSGRAPTVLAPDYNSGNEILAMRAAGAAIRYYPVGRDTLLDPSGVDRLADAHRPDVLYVIHYLGWSQPIEPLVELCRRRGMLLIEDCALSLLSERNGRPLGSFGDWSVFCLYKTLPIPNGAVLAGRDLPQMALRQPPHAVVLGRTAELVVQHIRSRIDGFGQALQRAKRSFAHAAGALEIPRAPVGDLGFKLADADLAMSPLAEHLLSRCRFEVIRRRRIENFHRLAAQIDTRVRPVHRELPPGVCPLFFPILVDDKRHTATALREQGVEALEFWNYGADPAAQESPSTRHLRAHVLALPIHQDLSPAHIDHAARVVNAIACPPREPPAGAGA